MTAPERIYMKPNDTYVNGWARPQDTDQFDEEGVEYVRADLARAPLAEALAVPEVKALVEAASPLMSMAMWTETAEDTEMVIVSVGTVRRIRAALRAIWEGRA